MLAATRPPLPDFQSPEQRQQYFKEHADVYTVSCRYRGIRHRSEHQTLEAARTAAEYVAKIAGRPAIIYGVIGDSGEWLENVQPS